MASPQIMASTPLSSTRADSQPRSRASSRSNLSLDLSDLPPLITPSPPSNTLLITNLNDPQIFHPANLQNFRQLLESQLATPLHSFSPLKSFRRIIIVFTSPEPAIALKSSLDGTVLHNHIVRCYFGEPTPLFTAEELEIKRHLQAPKVDKLFFISPPPSPPAGWEIRPEDPPNKEVHAEDLAAALAKLHAAPMPDSPAEEEEASSPSAAFPMEGVERVNTSTSLGTRSRSATIVFHGHDGHVPDLPAIAVEDTSEGEDGEEGSPMEGVERRFARTERPPVEV